MSASTVKAHSAPGAAAAAADDDRRDYFLIHSHWNDARWVFAPTNALEAERPVEIRWDFTLPSGRRFTDRSCAPLLESSRKLIALIRARSMSTGLAQRATTVVGYFSYLRELVRFMEGQGFTRFCDLDASALLSFQRTIERRTNQQGLPLATRTVQKYLDLLLYLHRFCRELGDGLTVHPCPGESTASRAGVCEANRRSWPYTPEPIAIALIQSAMEFLACNAMALLHAREVYVATVDAVDREGHGPEPARHAAIRALSQITIATPEGPRPIGSAARLAYLIDVLYTACFVVISYLVGPRASEVLQLKVGCVRPLENGDAEGAVIVGAIFKREAAYHGRPHEWIAPTPAVHAVSVLEALSAPHRERCGRSELWLRASGARFGAREWQRNFPGTLRVMSTQALRVLLIRCSAYFQLPLHEGGRWRLSTHQGRKTFVRFAALRDRSALLAIAQHLGHRERGITDSGYVGSDFELNREIEASILEQSLGAWEQMLTTPHLGGRAGEEILARRPHFQGARMKHDIKRYARMLVDSGLTLGVCDWGFCVYRQEHSACLGSISAPNPLHREPSTCTRCRNFVLTREHGGYWLGQVELYEALLREPQLPTQTLKIARERLTEALAMLRSIEPSGKVPHGSTQGR